MIGRKKLKPGSTIAGFGVQTADQGEHANRLVLEGLKKGIARIGWSYESQLDLRKLAKARESRKLTEPEHDAWRANHEFLDEVRKGDLLFYRNLPEQGRVTVVRVTGEYEFRAKSRDFRSCRTCRILVTGRRIADCPPALQNLLRIQGRFYRIKDEALTAFIKSANRRLSRKAKSGGRRRSTSRPKKKTGYSYLSPERQVKVLQRHERYKKRLETYLGDRDINVEFERDWVDIRFSIGLQRFFGEIKVTEPPATKDAFRMALGQLLDYGHACFRGKAGGIMFMDRKIEAIQLELASQLRIAVVCELDGTLTLCNPKVHRQLADLFPSSYSPRT